jgi:hypothetical protein
MDLKSRIIDKREGQIVDLLVENNKLREAAAGLRDALQGAFMSMADCSSRVKAPESYMLLEIKESLARYDEMMKGGE